MKTRMFLVVVPLFVMPVTEANAQAGMDSMKAEQPASKSAVTHTAVGIVKSVDRNKGTVTLAHGPVASLNWPAMTMGFTVKDKALFDKLPESKKVDFEFTQQGKDFVIIAVK